MVRIRVPARWAADAQELMGAVEQAVVEPGPRPIEARVSSMLTATQLGAVPDALKAPGGPTRSPGREGQRPSLSVKGVTRDR